MAVSVEVGKHYELVKPALKKKKNVFVEWPLAASVAQAEELTRLASAAGVHTSVGVQARADPLVVKVKDIVASGKIGRVIHSSATISAHLFPSDTWGEGGKYVLDHKSGGTVFTIFFGHCEYISSIVGFIILRPRANSIASPGQLHACAWRFY